MTKLTTEELDILQFGRVLHCRPGKARPELDRLIRQSIDSFRAMTPEQQEAELRKQRESLARQDMD